YYVIVGNGFPINGIKNNNQNCSTAIAQFSGKIKIIAEPIITVINLSAANYCANVSSGRTALEVAVNNTGNSTILYEWFSNKINSLTGPNLIKINNANNSSYTPLSTTAGDSLFYYVVATNVDLPITNNNRSKTSEISGNIKIYGKPNIVIDLDTTNKTYCTNNIPQLLNVRYTNGGLGQLSYTWYKYTSKSYNFLNPILNNNKNALLPNTNIASQVYYFVISSNGGPTACATDSSSFSGLITTNPGPTITSDIDFATSSANYCKNITANSINITATTGIVGLPINYQWYYKKSDPNNNPTDLRDTIKITSNTNGIGYNTNSLTPPSDSVNKKYYVVILSNTQNGTTCSIASGLSGAISIFAYPDTGISTNLNGGSYCKSDNNINNIGLPFANIESGTFSIQWYRTRSSNRFASTELSFAQGGNANAISPIRDSGVSYYYATLVNDGLTSCSITTKNSTPVNIYDAPRIILDISAENTANKYCTSTPSNQVSTISISVNNVANLGTLNYTWFVADDNSKTNETSISNSNSNSFVPPITTTGTKYYYVVVDNGGPNTCRYKTSVVSGAINVYKKPTIIASPYFGNERIYCQNTNADTLKITAINEGLGLLNYSWYVSVDNSNVNNGQALNSHQTTYTPVTAIVGTKYYYVLVTNADAPNLCNVSISAKSSAYTVNAGATIDSLINFALSISQNSYCKNIVNNNVKEFFAAASGDNLKYIWYKNDLQNNTTGWIVDSNSGASYVPIIDSVNTRYYYVKISSGSGVTCNTVSAVSNGISVFDNPAIDSNNVNISAANYCFGTNTGNITNLVIPAKSIAGGAAINYTWYVDSVSRKTNTNIVYSGTNNFFKPIANGQARPYYYYAILSNSINTNCKTTSDISGKISIFNNPIILSHPDISDRNYCINTNNILTISTNLYNTNVGTLSYRWYQSNDNVFDNSDSLIGGSSVPLSLNFGNANSKYYITIVDNGFTGTGNCKYTTSNFSGRIDIYNNPTIISNLNQTDRTYCQKDASANQLMITATNGGLGNLSYFWKSKLDNVTSNGTILADANTSSNIYTPSTDSVGTLYYYVVVQNNGPAACNSFVSRISGFYKINTNAIIIQHPQTTTTQYCDNATGSPISVSVIGTNLNIVWFKQTSNLNSNGTQVLSGTSQNYTPQINSALLGSNYYYIIATNTENGVSCSTTSNTSAKINVYAKPTITINGSSNTNYCISNTPSAPSIDSLVSITNLPKNQLNISWFRTNLSASNINGIEILDGSGNDTLFYPKNDTAGKSWYYVFASNKSLPSCNTTSDVSHQINIYQTPVIDSLNYDYALNKKYCKNDLASNLNVYANFKGGFNSLNYAWFSNTFKSTTGGTSLNSFGNSYAYNTSVNGSKYYYVVLSNGNMAPTACRTITSDVSGSINIYSKPTLGNPLDITQKTFCIGTTSTQLTINGAALNGPLGTISYQWFVTSTGSKLNASIISGSTGMQTTFIPQTTTAGQYNYYFVVTNTDGLPACLSDTSALSGTYTFVASPIISSQPSPNNKSYCQNSVADILTVSTSDTVNFQWYQNNVQSNTGGNPIPNATSANYLPPTTQPTTNLIVAPYFYAELTNRGGCKTYSQTSGSISVSSMPKITANSQSLEANKYCLNDIATTLSLQATIDYNSINYQWYSSLSPDGSQPTIESLNSTTNSFIPSTSNAGKKYYFVILTNNRDATCTTKSDISGAIEIFIKPIIFTQTNPTDKLYCKDALTDSLYLILNNGGYGVNTYKWFKNSSGTISNVDLLIVNNSSKYLPLTDSLGLKYYYAVIDNGGPRESCAITTSNLSGSIKVFNSPTINTHPASLPNTIAYCQNRNAINLNVAATNGGFGTLTYQWYSNSNPTNSVAFSTLISGETKPSFTPKTDVQNSLYYFVVVNNGGPANCNIVNSNVSSNIFINPTPKITNSPLKSDSAYCQNGISTGLNIVIDNNGGTTPAVKWYSNSVKAKTNGTQIAGAQNTTYLPNTTNINNLYYYAVITNTNNCSDTSDVSGLITILSQPTIDNIDQPLSYQSVCANSTPATLTVVSNGGVGQPNFQWFQNENNSLNGATIIPAQTYNSFTPSTTEIGTKYYFVKINYLSLSCNILTSNTSTFVVNALPVISTNISQNPANYCIGDVGISNLSIQASLLNGVLKYQWFATVNSNRTNSVNLVGLQAQTNTFTPILGNASSNYYYVVVQNGNTGCTITSNNSGLINVYNLPIVSGPSTEDRFYNVGETPNPLSLIAIAGSGNILNYQWYSNSTPSTIGSQAIQSLNNPSAILANFIPATALTGDNYYYAKITNGFGCYTLSNFSGNIRVNTNASITSQLDTNSKSYCQHSLTQEALSVTAVGGAANISGYQWYYVLNEKNYAKGVLINGEINSVFLPITDSVGTYYYYVVVSNSAGGKTTSIFSGAIIINPSPSYTNNLSSNKYCKFTPAQPLFVAISGQGTPVYRWYLNKSNTIIGATQIQNQNSNQYIPSTNNIGASYYFTITDIVDGVSGCNSITSSIATIQVYAQPIILTNPTSAKYCQGASSNYISVNTDNGGYGNLTYQWFKNSVPSNLNGVISLYDTNYYLNPTTLEVGTSYYYIVVNNGGPFGCNRTVSAFDSIIVNSSPSISKQPDSAFYGYSNSLKAKQLNVVSNISGGNLSYQWYVNSNQSNVGGTIIVDSVNPTLTPPINVIGIKYYYVVVNNSSSNSQCNSVISNAVGIRVYIQPQIISNPVSVTYCVQGPANPIKVSVQQNAGIQLKFQWYKNNENSNTGGIQLYGETDSTFIPPTSISGTYYYYCIISNNGPDGYNLAVSTVAKVDILNTPTFTLAVNTLSQNICNYSTSNSIEVRASSNTPSALTNLTYKWYKNTENRYIGASLFTNDSGVSSRIIPLINSIGKQYYFTIASNKSGASNICNTITSAISSVNVYKAPTIIIQPKDTSYCIGETFNSLFIKTDSTFGKLSYQWYSNNTSNLNNFVKISNAIDSFYTPSNILDTTFYYVEVFDIGSISNCALSRSKIVAVLNNPTPILTNSSNISSCSNQPFTISLTSSTTNTNIIWSRSRFIGIKQDSISGSGVINEILEDTILYPVKVNYIVNLKTNKGCESNNQIITINVYPKPVINLSKIINREKAYCINENTLPIYFESNLPNSTYYWYNSNTSIGLPSSGIGNIQSFTAIAQNQQTQYAKIFVQPYSQGCYGDLTDIAAIYVNPGLQSNTLKLGNGINNSFNLCYNTSPNLIASYNGTNRNIGASYTWYSSNDGILFNKIGKTIDTNFYADFQNTKKYYKVITEFGCTYSSNIIKVDTAPLPNVKIISFKKTQVAGGTSLTLSANDQSHISIWSDKYNLLFLGNENNPAPSITTNPIYQENAIYLLSTDNRGCSNTDTLQVNVDSTLYVLFISQNLISPYNNDGINENFTISNIEEYMGANNRIEIKVYDERDLLIYENNELKKVYDQKGQIIVWNGMRNLGSSNQNLNTGPYFYIIKIFTKEGSTERLKLNQTGSIMLLNGK
ncbi:MAG: gliding motility-associated C-terminal domain-containing protein, partial [Sediminibacterium sp.]|nr:gliding motility-associated C-terminal domain-containing protein [Sediminibacterium sp.]